MHQASLQGSVAVAAWQEVLEVRWNSRINTKGVIEKNVPDRIWSASTCLTRVRKW